MDLLSLLHPLDDDDNTTEVWGHRFSWTPEHPDQKDIEHLLHSYDTLADEALDKLDEFDPPTTKGWKCPHGDGPGARDLYALLKKYESQDETLGRLWEEVSKVPEWVDWEQIERGQRVIFRYNGQILLGLLYKSLVGGMGASRVVETLSRTGGFGTQVTRRRLLETLQHFIECASSLSSLQPGGQGFTSTVRVRLLHASVRRRILQLERDSPGYFPVSKLGIPINDLHSIGTISVYSSAIVYMALPRQGVYLSEKEIEDYFAVWRWVGYLLGAPVDWLATPAKAKAMMESIMVMEVNPSETSGILANNILTGQVNVPPLYLKREFLAAIAYRMNGDDLAGALGIEKPGLGWRLLVYVQCAILFVSATVYAYLPEHVQRRRDQNFIKFCNHMITSHKMGGIGKPSQFDFQYVPNIGQLTEPTQVIKAVGAIPTAPIMKVLGLVLQAVGLAAVVYGGIWCLKRYGMGSSVPVEAFVQVCK